MNKSENKGWEESYRELNNISREMPFAVPENYFEKSRINILTQIQLSRFYNSSDGFTVPENFFVEEQQQITRKVSYLSSLDHRDGFKTPPQYFEDLSKRIQLQLTTEVTPTKKILKVWTSQFMKYAAAACFIMITATALYFNTEEQKYIVAPNTEYFIGEDDLYDIDVETIIEHVDFNKESPINATLSDSETEAYILNNYSHTELLSEY